MHIERIDGTAARGVNAVEELRQLHEIHGVLQRAGPAAPVEVGTIGRPADGREGDPLSANPDGVFGVSRMKDEFGRRGLQRLLDNVAADADPVARHDGAGIGQNFAASA